MDVILTFRVRGPPCAREQDGWAHRVGVRHVPVLRGECHAVLRPAEFRQVAVGPQALELPGRAWQRCRWHIAPAAGFGGWI